jgi:hypothetical protein
VQIVLETASPNKQQSWVQMLYTCNPSYSEGRDLEDAVQSQPWANSSRDPISKIPNTKKGWWSG